ncbi:MAG: hypothetical protein KKD39_08080 [Candidatus Altiarchaeota archaeon]|nr:hypothetical protein [Candidatus Altiarchaeota archaeon]
MKKKTLKRLTTKRRAQQQTKKRKNRLEARKIKGQTTQNILTNFKRDLFELGNPEHASPKTTVNTKTKVKIGNKGNTKSHMSEKQKVNKKTLASRKKANKISKKKINDFKSRMRNKSKR